MFKWPVVSLCEKQLRDVDPNDVLAGGLYRLCDIYKGGGGYDRFNGIYEKRFGWWPQSKQFVVQMYGCPLSCAYCYVTKEGVWGSPTLTTTTQLLSAYQHENVDVFHLMGGAPAIYLEYWKYIAEFVNVFHSDFLLVEQEYDKDWLEDLPGLHAVSIKHFLDVDKYPIFWNNFDKLVECGVNFYITFTGKTYLYRQILERYGKGILEDNFNIPIIEYEAIKWK